MSSDRSFWSDERAVADVAELRPHEAAEIAGRDVLQVENAEEVGAHLDEHAALESCRLKCCHKFDARGLEPSELGPVKFRGVKTVIERCRLARRSL